MEVLEIGTIIENALLAIHWDSDNDHVLDEMATRLTDVEYLKQFFDSNPKGLQYYKKTKENAVVQTITEAAAIIEELYSQAENSLTGRDPDLNDLFEPLHRQEAFNHPRYYTDYKVTGYEDAPWVRLYAVKLDENLYVLTGYAIKMVRRMQDDPLLEIELEKLEIATQYLKDQGILT